MHYPRLRNTAVSAAIAALCAVAPHNAEAQQTKLLTAEKHNEYGLVYSLPLTALQIEVTAKCVTRTAGPYWQYARRYMGTDKAITHDSQTWTVTSVQVTPYGVSDSSRQYVMQLKPGALTYMGVAEDGMLLSINKRPEAPKDDKEREGKVNTGNSQERINPREYLQYVDEDFIASQSTGRQAQMLAETLMEIRDAKVSLTRGTAETMPSDGKQLELMLNSLAHQEAAMTAAFLGTETVTEVTRSFTYVPDEEGKTVLFRLSDFGGIVEADDYSGAPVYITVGVTDQGELPVDAKGETKKMPKDGVMYCIPGAARITLDYEGKQLFSREYEMAQYGIEFALAPSLFTDRKAPSYAVFDPATGALREIGVMRPSELTQPDE